MSSFFGHPFSIMPSIISLMVGDSSPLVYLSIKKLCALRSPREAAVSAAKIGRSDSEIRFSEIRFSLYSKSDRPAPPNEPLRALLRAQPTSPPAPPNSQIQRAPVRCPGPQPLGQLTKESREDLARTARQGATDSQPTPKPGANPASQGRHVSPRNPQPAKPPCSPRHALMRHQLTQISSSALPPAHRHQSLPSVC